MKGTKMLAILVLALGLMDWLSGVSEAVPPMGTAFTYQGRLIDANGPAEGLYDFEFKLWMDPCEIVYPPKVGDTLTMNDLDVIDGYFTVELDFNSPFAFNGYARWLEISVRPGDSNDVNDFVTLSPRQEVTPTPYALQTRGIFVDENMNIGMGTTSPKGKLHVDGGKAADDTDAGDITIKAQDGGDAVRGLRGGRGGNIILLPGEGGESPGLTPPGPSGKVGIGTAGPEAMLDVRGNIKVDQKIQAYDSGGLELATDEGTTRIFVADDGKVGIGTSTPESRLHVNQTVGAWGEGIRLSYGDHNWDLITDTSGERLLIVQDQIINRGLAIKNGDVGIGEASPLTTLHVQGTDRALPNDALGGDDIVAEDWIAILGLYSDDRASYGSGIALGEFVDATATLKNKWSIYRMTGPSPALRFSFGTERNVTANPTRLTITAGGGVGIGTTSPGAKLDVRSPGASEDAISVHGSGGHEMFQVTQDDLGNGKVFVRDASGGTKIQLCAYGYSLFKGGNVGIGDVGVPTSKLVVRGNILVKSEGTGANVLELGEGLDYAEGFDVTEEADIEAGTVLVIDSVNPGKLTVSRSAYDSKVAGIVAGANGIGSGVRLGVDQFDHDVALAGRVYCNVDTTDAAVQPGDLLTTSGTVGYAMKATDHERAWGAVLGKAMESLEKGQKGQILVLVTLQ